MSLSAQIKDEGAKSMVNAHLVQPLEGIILDVEMNNIEGELVAQSTAQGTDAYN